MIKNLREFLKRYKAILFITGLASAGVLGVIIFFNISNNNYIDFISKYTINRSKNELNTIEKNYLNLFSATIEALLKNKEIGELFSNREKEALYDYCLPLFNHFKNNNGITHWYFLDPEPGKKCFLRIHAPHKYDDVITRVTLDRCIETKKPAYGKELGKTAFALRLVHPYYFQNRLIGYMELGLELEHLFQLMKMQTGNEYGLLAKKEYMDKDKWASVRAEKKLRNNWDDMKKLLVVSKTTTGPEDDAFIMDCSRFQDVPREGMVLDRIHKGEQVIVRGIFPLYDAAQKKVGCVFVLKDISHIFSGMQAQKQEIVLMVIAFMSLITFFMIFFHKRAEKELRRYRFHLEEMIQERTAELQKINENLNREIREHRQAQEALKQEWKARIEAERKHGEAIELVERSSRLASIGVMASGITHEINQPLNAIKVTADSIQYWHKHNPGILPDMFLEQLENISKSVDRISEIIRHMRTFWVLPDTPEVSIVNLNQAVKKSLSMVDRQLDAHGIAYEWHIGHDPLFLKGNLVHLEQVTVNLVANAMHSLDETQKPEKKIEISTLAENSTVSMVIKDNGMGLPLKKSEKLFDPFFSTRKAGEGTGLGLAIVKNYVDRYNGSIEAGDNEGGGATFTVRFPMASETG